MTSASIPQAVDYLLIGGGLASATAAKAIRQRDPRGSILLVTDELELPYHRPPLSKEYLRGEIGAEGVYGKGGVYVHRRPWYAEQRIEVQRGVEARALDGLAQRTSGESLSRLDQDAACQTGNRARWQQFASYWRGDLFQALPGCR